MVKTLLVDSSIVIDFLRRESKEQSFLHKYVEEGYRIVCSIIAVAELYSGRTIWHDKKAMHALETALSEMAVLQINTQIAKKAGRIRSDYSTALIDAIIAATALIENLPLATLNIRDFKKVKKLQLL